jgi:hypothetical protein
VTDLTRDFGAAFREGAVRSAELNKAEKLEARAQILGITPVLYQQIAETQGEEPLMERVAQELAMVDASPLVKAMREGNGREWRALTEDPFEPISSWGGWRERPGPLSWEMLQGLAYRLGPFTAFLQLRLNQVLLYAVPQEDQHGPGFIVRKKGAAGNDPRLQSQPSKQQALEGDSPESDDRARWLENVVVNCGFTQRYDAETGQTRDGISDFLRKLVRDSLIYDQTTVELQRDRSGRLIAWRAVDAKSIRRASHDEKVKNERGEPVIYAQVINGTIAADFSPLDLAFRVRNPRSDLRAFGYGLPELEMCISTITALLNGFEYNARYFTQGVTSKGIVSLHGLVPRDQLTAFRRFWTALVTGQANAWRAPVLNLPDEKSSVKWVDLQKSNLDMEWARFMDWCLKVVCAVLQVAPEEIGFQFGNQGQTSSIGGTQSPKDKLDAGKDKGLKPLLTWLAQVLNEEVIWKLAPEYELAFVGLDADSEQAQVELLSKEVGSFLMVDEARAARNLPPLPKKLEGPGQVICNPTWLQAYQAGRTAAMGAGGMGGMPGGGGGGGSWPGDVGAFEDYASGGQDQGQAGATAPPGGEQGQQGQPAAKSLTAGAQSGRLEKSSARRGRVTRFEFDF